HRTPPDLLRVTPTMHQQAAVALERAVCDESCRIAIHWRALMPTLDDAFEAADRLAAAEKPRTVDRRREKRELQKLLEAERRLQEWFDSPQGQAESRWRHRNEERAKAELDRRDKVHRARSSLANAMATGGDLRLRHIED